jgi:uncharacterized protein
MSQVENSSATHALNDALVAEYLETNPDFFKGYPELLMHMNLDQDRAGATSLVERQLKGLRARNKEMSAELAEVILHAQNNQYLLEQTVQFAIDLLHCNNISDLYGELSKLMGTLYEIEFVNLTLNEQLFNIDNPDALANIKSALADNCPQSEPVCGRLPNAAKQAIFGDQDVNSVAILPLGAQGEYGLLTLGSDDATQFDPEMGDLFLVLIGQVLTALLDRIKN